MTIKLNNVENIMDEAKTFFDLAVLFFRNGKNDAAIDCWRRSIILAPSFADAWCNMGMTYSEKLLLQMAVSCQMRANLISPRNAAIKTNLAHSLLSTGNFREGFAAWEHREMSPARNFSKPRWDGGTRSATRILAHAEQGYGDTIQFCRYLPLLARQGHQVVVEARSPLLPLLAQLEGVASLCSWGDELPDFDFHVPITSLASHFEAGQPDGIPYLFAPDGIRQIWKDRMSELKNFKVGIVWTGNQSSVDARRGIDPIDLLPLLDLSGIDLVSLQRDNVSHDLPFAMELGQEINDFAQLSGIIDNLDLVISVDTATAHLAGAMGKPVWVMLHSCPDWRWLPDPVRTVWYQSARLYRQQRPGNWKDVVEQIVENLRGIWSL